MYCPKCGTENPDGARLCSSCSSVLTGISTIAPAPDARTSGLAVASLVLAILSFFTFFITAIPAFILGLVSIFKIEKSAGKLKGKGLAIVGIAVPAVAVPFALMLVMLGILMPALARVRLMAYRQVCATNMSTLGKAMLVYANDHDGKYPSTSNWCDLLIEYAEVDERMFRCRAARCYKGVSGKLCSYAMNKNIEELGANAPPDMVLLFETGPGWNQSGGPEILTIDNHQREGCNVLFVDSHVQFVRTEDINDLKWTAE
jgi:prepilin-type processing-associated H-X9-DG protein